MADAATDATRLTTPACLIGHFTEQVAHSIGSYRFNGTPLQLQGLKGEIYVESTDGRAVDDYNHAAPLRGTYGGRPIALFLRGKVSHQILSIAHGKITEKDLARSMTGWFIYAGHRYAFSFAGPLSHKPYTLSYRCTGTGFTDHGTGGTDAYKRT